MISIVRPNSYYLRFPLDSIFVSVVRRLVVVSPPTYFRLFALSFLLLFIFVYDEDIELYIRIGLRLFPNSLLRLFLAFICFVIFYIVALPRVLFTSTDSTCRC